MIKKIFSYFFAWKIITLIFAYFAALVIPFNFTNLKFTAVSFFGRDLPYYLWIWGNFDGNHYMEIAKNGYQGFENAFFPFYPLLINLFFSGFYLIGREIPYLVIGQLLSNVSLFLALIVIYKTLLIDNEKNIFNYIFLIILLFPASFFYQSVYNDSLFLLLSTLTLYFSRKRSFLKASIFGALATSTRLNGLALFFVILTEFFYNKEDWSIKDVLNSVKKQLIIKNIFKEKIYSIILIPISFLGYLFYTQIFYKSWNLVFSSQSIWHRDKLVLPIQTIWRYIKIIFFNPHFQINYFIAVFELLFFLFYIFMVIYSYKKIRFSYWIFLCISILIPSLTGTFQGMPRYGLHIFPLFLAFTLFLKKRSGVFKFTCCLISLALLFLLLGLFTRGYFVA